jgi:hypothetical protein
VCMKQTDRQEKQKCRRKWHGKVYKRTLLVRYTEILRYKNVLCSMFCSSALVINLIILIKHNNFSLSLSPSLSLSLSLVLYVITDLLRTY